jgi:phosphomannomutase
MLEKILKSYDIRGIVPDQLNEEVMADIGRRFAFHFTPKTVVVGCDMRLTSNSLKQSLIAGLIEQGSNVIDIGLVSTPMLYFSVPFLKAQAGIMVTASHNPLNYNGLKFCDEKAHPIFKENGLLKLLEGALFHKSIKGQATNYDIKGDYLNFIKTHLTGVVGHFALDPMWGTNSLVVKDIFGHPGIKAEYISASIDGQVPGYQSPNPLIAQNQTKIIEAIKDNKCDLGFMWDGDGDRLLVFDDEGNFVSPHIISYLITELLLGENPGQPVVCDLRTSGMVKDVVDCLGGSYYQAKAGNPYVKDIMRNVEAIFGAETSGHYMFKESNYSEDTFLAAIYVIKAIQSKGLKLSEIVSDMEKRYFIIPETNFRVDSVDTVLSSLKKRFPGAAKIYLDGLTLKEEDWWANIRSSNTEPLIRLNMEACSKSRLDQIFKQIVEVIGESGGTRSDH